MRIRRRRVFYDECLVLRGIGENGYKKPKAPDLYRRLRKIKRFLDASRYNVWRKFHNFTGRTCLPPAFELDSLGAIDSLLAAQHVLEMFRRALTQGPSGGCLDRLSNRLTRILSEARKLRTP
jgi:hypothetical protein